MKCNRNAMKVYESLLISQPFEANFETVCSISNHMESPGKFRISAYMLRKGTQYFPFRKAVHFFRKVKGKQD